MTAMLTRIEISDTRIENADSTIGFELKPPEPLRIVFSYSGAITASYMDYGNGLFNLIKSICKNWRMVRKLKILIELENEEVNGDGVSS